jgi:hypothetical protein
VREVPQRSARAVARRDLLEKTLDEALPTAPYAETIYRLRAFRGIDTLTASGLRAEIGDFARFAKPGQLCAYLGIDRPSTRPTASAGWARSPRQAQVTPQTARRGRLALCRPPRVGETLERRQRGMDPRVVAIAWRCQHRLYDRHRNRVATHRRPERSFPRSAAPSNRAPGAIAPGAADAGRTRVTFRFNGRTAALARKTPHAPR